MLGHIEEWFYGALAGIRPDPFSPGLKKIRIEPQPAGDVTWVKSSLETPRGPVKVHWRLEAGVFHLTLDVPPGVTAEVHLPKGQPQPLGSGHHELQSPQR
jgi:alpha-L-rhamnosidase